MGHRIVLRMKGLFPNQLGKFQMHARRSGGDLSHVDETKSGLNEIVLGAEDWADRLRAEVADAAVMNLAEEIAARRARKRPTEARAAEARGPVDPWKFTRVGPLREGILTVNKDWFGGSGADQWAPERVEAFKERGVAFLTECFAEICVHARIDCDEEALHFHFVLAPWHEKVTASRGRQRLLQPSSHPLLAYYEQAQDLVAEYFSDLGIIRGHQHAAAQREAKARGEALPPRPVHVPPSLWRARQQEAVLKALEEAAARQTAADEREQRTIALSRALRAIERQEIVYLPGATMPEDQLSRGPAYPTGRDERQALKSALNLCQADLHRHLRAFAEAAQVVTAEDRARVEAEKQALSEARAQLEAREGKLSHNRNQITRIARQVAGDAQKIAGAVEDLGLEAVPELAGIVARYRMPRLGAPEMRPRN